MVRPDLTLSETHHLYCVWIGCIFFDTVLRARENLRENEKSDLFTVSLPLK